VDDAANGYEAARLRFRRKLFRRRWTHRRWWLRGASVHVGFARVARKMGNGPAEVAAQLAEAAYCRRVALAYSRTSWMPRPGR